MESLLGGPAWGCAVAGPLLGLGYKAFRESPGRRQGLTMKTHCLLFLFGGLVFALCAQVPPASAQVHPGKCPKPMGFGLCAEMCAKDSDCRADEKCCSNSCGHNCMKAIRVTPGRCPRPPPVGPCALLCMDDSDCPAGRKCCSTACGRACRKAIQG
ncbi:UNVERIFIED_CONTAM: hypothetical protein K2H54_073318 [Gekko kuhli]